VSHRRNMRFTELGDLLGGVLEEALPDDPGLRARLAAEAFLESAGPAVAGRCRVKGLEGDVLLVAVETPRWRRELQRMGRECLRQVNGRLPRSLALTAIRFTDP